LWFQVAGFAVGAGTAVAYLLFIMDILTLLIVGLAAGVLASVVVGGIGYGIIGDIAVGIAGAFFGTWIFRAAHWSAPFGGLAGTVAVAFIGAVVLLLILQLFRRARI
jgi:uncharacterized membrane protein YeaQ/YmgE (transglycosylase-associated protein family)